jgi:hypothetical protein
MRMGGGGGEGRDGIRTSWKLQREGERKRGKEGEREIEGERERNRDVRERGRLGGKKRARVREREESLIIPGGWRRINRKWQQRQHAHVQ